MYRSLNTWQGGLNLNRHYPSPLSIANDMNTNNANKSVYCQWQVFSLEGDRSSVKIDDNQSPLSPWKFIALLFKKSRCSDVQGCSARHCEDCEPHNPVSCVNCTQGYYSVQKRVMGNVKCVKQCPDGFTPNLNTDGKMICKDTQSSKSDKVIS